MNNEIKPRKKREITMKNDGIVCHYIIIKHRYDEE